MLQVSFDDEEQDDFTGELDGLPFADGLPLTSTNQHCFCGAEPTWLYRIAVADCAFRVGTKGFTLPSFVTLCTACKALAEQRDATGLRERELIRRNDSDWQHRIAEGFAAVLTRADLTDGRPLCATWGR